MIAQQNVTYLYIGANAACVATAVPGTARYIGIKKVGETLCGAAGALAAGDRFQVLYLDLNGKVQKSPVFDWTNVISKSKLAPIAAAAQVTSIGYNGTSGSIDLTDYGKYIVTIGFKDSLKQFGNKRLFKYAQYTADSTARQDEIALNLAAALQINLENDAYQRILVKALCNAAVTSGNAFDHNATVVQGTQYVTVGTNKQYAAGSDLAVGDYVRFGTVGAGTALTNDVYQVTELTSTTVFKVDRIIQVASGTYATATDDLEVIPAATGAAANWGLVLTANDSAKPFELGKWSWDAIRFDTSVSADFGSTTVSVDTKPTKGVGSYKDIATLDWELQNNYREPYRIAEYPVTFVSNAVSTDTYNYIYNIRFADKSTETIGGTADSYTQLMIASMGGTLSADLDTFFTL